VHPQDPLESDRRQSEALLQLHLSASLLYTYNQRPQAYNKGVAQMDVHSSSQPKTDNAIIHMKQPMSGRNGRGATGLELLALLACSLLNGRLSFASGPGSLIDAAGLLSTPGALHAVCDTDSAASHSSNAPDDCHNCQGFGQQPAVPSTNNSIFRLCIQGLVVG